MKQNQKILSLPRIQLYLKTNPGKPNPRTIAKLHRSFYSHHREMFNKAMKKLIWSNKKTTRAEKEFAYKIFLIMDSQEKSISEKIIIALANLATDELLMKYVGIACPIPEENIHFISPAVYNVFPDGNDGYPNHTGYTDSDEGQGSYICNDLPPWEQILVTVHETSHLKERMIFKDKGPLETKTTGIPPYEEIDGGTEFSEAVTSTLEVWCARKIIEWHPELSQHARGIHYSYPISRHILMKLVGVMAKKNNKTKDFVLEELFFKAHFTGQTKNLTDAMKSTIGIRTFNLKKIEAALETV